MSEHAAAAAERLAPAALVLEPRHADATRSLLLPTSKCCTAPSTQLQIRCTRRRRLYHSSSHFSRLVPRAELCPCPAEFALLGGVGGRGWGCGPSPLILRPRATIPALAQAVFAKAFMGRPAMCPLLPPTSIDLFDVSASAVSRAVCRTRGCGSPPDTPHPTQVKTLLLGRRARTRPTSWRRCHFVGLAIQEQPRYSAGVSHNSLH